MADYYEPYDQAEKLGPPPWDPLAEDVALWERAHGHDVRLSCDESSGCLVVVSDAYRRGYADGYARGRLHGRLSQGDDMREQGTG